MELDLTQDLRKLGYAVERYNYDSLEAQKVHERIMSSERGTLVLWDLVKGIKTLTGHETQIKPRSIYRPDMLKEPLLKYFTGTKTNTDKQALARAYDKVRKMFYVGKLKPRQLGQTDFWPQKSAGAPTFKKKGEVFEDELMRAERLLSRKEKLPPVTVFQRGKDDKVVRPVFAYPMSVTLIEAMFFFPYQDEVLLHNGPYIGGRRYSEIAGNLNEIRLKSDWVLEMDYSGFDGSISSQLIGLAFNIIRNNFDLSKDEEKAFDFVVKYFVNCPVLLPHGWLVHGKKHGVPSGSMFTQLIDSIVNALVIEYCCAKLSIGTSRYYVLGDDSVIGGYGRQPDLERVASVALELGIIVNKDKSSVRWANSKSGKFLGHNWSKGYATREFEETMSKLVCPERPLSCFRGKGTNYVAELANRIEDYANDNLDCFGILEDLEEMVIADGRLLNQPRRRTIYHVTKVMLRTDWYEEWYLRITSNRNGSRVAVHL